MSRTLKYLLIAVVLTASACFIAEDVPQTSLGPSSSGFEPQALCKGHSDCAPNMGCDPLSGHCIILADNSALFSVQLVPPHETALPSDQFVGIHPNLNGAIDISLSAPLMIQGVVAHEDPKLSATPKELLAGTLVAVAEGKIPGTHYRSETIVRNRLAGGEEYTFSLSLRPGIDYQITFIPADTTLPIHQINARFSESTIQHILLPPKTQYTSFKGRTVLDARSKDVISGALVSCAGDLAKCTATTTDSQGRFELLIAPSAHPPVLRVTPGKNSIVFPVQDFSLQSDWLTDDSEMLLEIGPIPVSHKISIQVVGQTEKGLVGLPTVQVLLNGTISNGLVSTTEFTDKQGIVDLTLLEGLYEITVIPSPESDFGWSQSTLDLTQKQADSYAIVLHPRPRLTGYVLHHETSLPLQNVAVSLLTKQFSNMDNVSGDEFFWAFNVITDQDGRFELPFEPGRYAITVTPSSQSGLPRFSQPEITLTPKTQRMTVRVPNPILVKGRILGANGEGMEDVNVQYFFYRQSIDSLWEQETDLVSDLVGLAGNCRTTFFGDYSLVLPQIVVPGDPEVFSPASTEDIFSSEWNINPYGLPLVELE